MEFEEIKDKEKDGETLTPKEDAPDDEEQQQQTEKMLTQSQVNELVGRARKEGRESALKELYERYGVSDENDMNEIFGKGQAYDDLNEEYIGQGNSYKDVMAENALLKTQIDADRWEDVKLILGGKGLEINEENITSLLSTHPEWKKEREKEKITLEDMDEIISEQRIKSDIQPAKLKKLGNESSVEKDTSEEDEVKRLFGF